MPPPPPEPLPPLDVTLLEQFYELPPELLVPAVVAGVLVGAFVARRLIGERVWRVVEYLRTPGESPLGPVDSLTDGAVVTQRGTLAADADGAVTLAARGATFALEGGFTLYENRRALPDAERRALLAKRPTALVRGVYRRRADASGGEAYRGSAARHVITPEKDAVEATRVGAPPPLGFAMVFALAGALVGVAAGVATPSELVPRVLRGPPREPRLRVRSIEPFRVVLEPVPGEVDPTCWLRLLTPARWDVARHACAPSITLQSPDRYASWYCDRLGGAAARPTCRAIAIALGSPSAAAELAVVPGDAGSYRTAIRESFAAAAHDGVWRFARAAPPAVYPEVAAEVLTTYLFTRRQVEGETAAFARAVAAAAPAGTSESLACLEAFWSWPAGRSPVEALAYATRPGAPPACVILGATTARRGLDSLRPLEGLERDSAVWRPLIDAAKNYVLLEGIASGAIRASPSDFETYGDWAEQRATMSRGVAHLIESSAGALEARGYDRLAWQARFPAWEAIVRANFLDALTESAPHEPWPGSDQAWVDGVTAAYLRAIDYFPVARARDHRLDAALQWLHAGAALFDADVRRLRALSAAFALPATPEARTLDLPQVTRARAALQARDARGLAAALGAPSAESVAAARVVGSQVDRPHACNIDPLVCAWLFDALRDERAAAQPWSDRRVVLSHGHDHADFEWRGEHHAMSSPYYRPALENPPAPWIRFHRTAWVDPSTPTDAFVRAVAEALQRSLAGAR